MSSPRKRKLAFKRWRLGKSRYYCAIELHRKHIEAAILFCSPRQFGKTTIMTSLMSFIADTKHD